MPRVPLKAFLDVDVTLPAEKVSSFSDAFFASLNKTLLKIKSILLVENVVESVKVGGITYNHKH